ncbi:hypothetical protein BegalDRAFT_3503 [Beggiatoa alba B18LD]|uniref:GTPase n=1 Tax=Beggiatoa alba B18LD TaxID=395493 RepID=I3CL20_9GAMM|nr:GTPase domain-containing protein [Beggiatoa alba]EIJ44313.1 hypothetical protein BegalDRAFT_3503 [Beggiatoa alba B18LD]
MAIIDKERDVIVFRIVYDGLPQSGKTTSIYSLANVLGRTNTLYSPPTEAGQAPLFEWIDYVGGFFRGHSIACQIITTPSDPALHAHRQFLLNTADVVIFIIDTSNADTLEESLHYFQALQTSLPQEGEEAVRIIIQANQYLSKETFSLEDIQTLFNNDSAIKIVETVAKDGKGIRDTFVLAVRYAVERAEALMMKGKLYVDRPNISTGQELFALLQNQISSSSTSPSATFLANAVPETTTTVGELNFDDLSPEEQALLAEDASIVDSAALSDELHLEDLSFEQALVEEEDELNLQDLSEEERALLAEDTEIAESLPAELAEIHVESDEINLDDLSEEERALLAEDTEIAESLPAELAENNDDNLFADAPELLEKDAIEPIETENETQLAEKLDKIEENLLTQTPSSTPDILYEEVAELTQTAIPVANITSKKVASVRKSKRLPLFPDEEISSQWIWPPLAGRHMIGEVIKHPLRPHLDANDLWHINGKNGWRCFSKSAWLFESEADARAAFRQQIALHIHCSPILSDNRCIAMVEDAHDTWRLWQILYINSTLEEQLNTALHTTNPAIFATELFRCAVEYIDAYSDCMQYCSAISPTLENLGKESHDIIYTGILDNNMSVRKATPTEALTYAFAPLVADVTQQANIDIVEVLKELQDIQAFEYEGLLNTLGELFL